MNAVAIDHEQPNPELAKYAKLWAGDAYRVYSPGAASVQKFMEVANPSPGEILRDLGCGSGRAGVALADYGLCVTQYDFVAHCRDADVALPFALHDLTQAVPGAPADYAYCCDVLEHIPPEQVARVLRVVVAAGRRAFLQISCVDDVMGAAIGETLHLTVQPYAWWKEQLEEFDCRIIWSEDLGAQCSFFVSGYADATEFGPKTVLNVSHDTINDNVRANLAHGYKEVAPHEVTETPLMILAGGPSLADFEEEIIERRKAGEFLVSVNNTHQWCRERGITPSIHIACDAREFNARFTAQPFERCRYLIASQCHPAIAAALPKEQVLMWHSGHHLKDVIDAWDAEHGTAREWYPIFGGGTVMLRGIPLLMLLGFKRFEIFGFDSCLRGDIHHAYPQPENDRTVTTDVVVGGRTFRCHPWMVAQAGDFIRLLGSIGKVIDLNVRGDGLIAHCISTAAAEEA